MFERPHLQILAKRIQEPRKLIQIIMGPRQVGKTTLVTQLTQKLKTGFQLASADALSATRTVWLQQQWEAARIKMDLEKADEFILIVDEIQKIDNWSETVKACWDADTQKNRNLKLILLGSSRLLLKQGLTESLAGRFETLFMGHWSFSEMQQAFGWNADQYVWFGGYPGPAGFIGDETRWKNYVRDSLIETSISRDILMLTRVDKPALMKQLFELGCQYSGQVLSYNKMLGQLQDAGNTTTLAHYLSLLDTAGLLAGIEKYHPAALRKKASSPKLQVYNTALISAQRVEKLDDIRKQPEEWGRLVESAVGAHLLNQAAAGSFGLYYWREGNEEVDFVIQSKNTTGLEVKSGGTKKASGLEAFRKKFPAARLLMAGNSALTWQDILRADPLTIFGNQAIPGRGGVVEG